ncbi:DUF6510 family protein [Herbiconiux moechotypicola]|uniref:DUF6510 family protein n=1 Tax=Herbiconiux moechotypicola TaxID=637393 RepID=A0ABN3DDV0_9MICO|nr:DUF6510 family protein [Herbiconiux moechotypicola]MCS5729222.1 DUF6510 family protein [Herbiconiux moechotypicola]
MAHPEPGRVAARVDGNAAAGALAEVFCFDVTEVLGECAHCGARALLAEAEAELDDEGVIVLCRSCGHTLLTYLSTPAGRSLQLPGLASLTLP